MKKEMYNKYFTIGEPEQIYSSEDEGHLLDGVADEKDEIFQPTVENQMQREIRQATIETLEKPLENRVSFAETVRLLEGKIDLKAKLIDQIKSHHLWGLVDAMVQAGTISDISQYQSLFDTVTINKDDLLEVIERTKSGTNFIPIFNPGHLSLKKIFDVIFPQSGVKTWTYGDLLDTLREVDQKNLPHFDRYHDDAYDDANREKRLAIMMDLYKSNKAEPVSPGGAQLHFITDGIKIGSIKDLQENSKKSRLRLIDPGTFFLWYRYQLDTILLKTVDRLANFYEMDKRSYREILKHNIHGHSDFALYPRFPFNCYDTVFENYVYENGKNLSIGFDSYHGCIFIANSLVFSPKINWLSIG